MVVNNGKQKQPAPGQGKSKSARRRRRQRAQGATNPRRANQNNGGGQRGKVPYGSRLASYKGKRSSFDVSMQPVQSNIIPRNELNKLQMTQMVSKNKMVQDYVGTLIDPKGGMLEDVLCRKLPDSFNRPTAVVRSVLSYDIPVFYSSSTSDTGRFAVAVQPWLGGLDSPAHYKTAIADVLGPWSNQDWSSSAVYMDALGKQDPRIDPFYTTLTQPPKGVYQIFNAASSVTPKVFLDGTGTPLEFSNSGAFLYNSDAIELLDTGSGNSNEWQLGPGQYAFSYESTTGDTFTAAPTLTVVSANTGDMQKDLNHTTKSPDSKMVSLFHLLTVENTVTVRLNSALTTVGATYTNSIIRFTPCYYSSAVQGGTAPINVNANSIPSSNFGLTQQYRTVAMSVLATFIGSSLNNGGTIATAYVPGSTLQTDFFTSSPMPAFGQLQNWENVARIPGSYNGELRNGCYTWWSPEDTDGYILKPPDLALEGDPPGIVVSGQFTPNDVPGTDTYFNVLRLEVVTLYEVSTMSQLFDSEKYIGSQAILDEANRILGPAPHSMQNATHNSFLGDVWSGFKQGLGYFKKGFDIALPIISAL